MVLEARRSQARAQADVAAGEGSHPIWQTPAVSSHGLSSVLSWGEEGEISEATFSSYKDTSPVRSGSQSL